VLILKKSPDELGAQKEELKGVLTFIDNALGKSRYLAGRWTGFFFKIFSDVVLSGETPTIADLFVVPEVDQVQIFGLFDLSSFSHITRWIADLKEHVKGYAESAATVSAIAAQLSQPK
jgi:glutathione S-transferase